MSISSDGNMLAVSTLSAVKIFHLRSSKSSANDSVKLRKAETPTNLAVHGSKLLQFSPDSKWLLTIRCDDSIYLHRIAKIFDAQTRPKILERGVELLRSVRTPKDSPTLQHGSLGKYEMSIIRTAWSSDSRILALCDLQGHLDSWVLEGYEDLSQSSDYAVNGHPLMAEPARDDEESDEELDEEAHPLVVLGQRWIRNPRNLSLPRLPSFPLVMSFRPAWPSSVAALTNGHITMHPTRHNPNPHSHDLPIGEDRLFVLTSFHKVYEYQIFAGKLSDWSRRNPPSMLSEEFQVIRDRAMNCIWDISGSKERVWIYGSSFLWMFDLARDLPAVEQKLPEVQSQPGRDSRQITRSSKKRKRKHVQEQRQSAMQGTTGAGNRIPEKELITGIGSSIHKTTGSEQNGGQWVSMQTIHNRAIDKDDDAIDDDDVEIATGGLPALVRLRRENGGLSYMQDDQQNGDAKTDNGRLDNGDAVAHELTDRGLASWHTFKYRPILGIVVLSDESSLEDDSLRSGEDVHKSPRGLEVALVERPSWDLDLPPRYHGDQEWDK